MDGSATSEAPSEPASVAHCRASAWQPCLVLPPPAQQTLTVHHVSAVAGGVGDGKQDGGLQHRPVAARRGAARHGGEVACEQRPVRGMRAGGRAGG